MGEESRTALAMNMLTSLPKFGAWASGVREFKTPHGKIGFRQLAILWFLRYETAPDESVSPSQIAAYNAVQPSVITRALAKLEASGLIERTIDPVDHRRFRITMTPKGMDVSIYVEKLYMDDLLASMAHLDESQIRELDRNVAILDAISDDLQDRQAKHRAG
ncbi:MAG TPA: MarR family transcriptional regulator [Thermomicrobiales bacterium]|nr:MarR family transcriptional regulator [Thermomicrobiales bacterium]